MAKAQGLFNLVGGLWPIVALGSFEWVFGPKRDDWLQKASGGLFAFAGLAQLLTEESPEAVRVARRLGMGAALTYLVVDLVYVPAGRIPKTYLLDAAMEIGWLVAWAQTLDDL